MSDNMPILYKNIMDALPSDFSRDVFLWATDKFKNDRGCYKAEKFAYEVDSIIRTIKNLIDIRQIGTLCSGGRVLDQEQELDLLRFIQARHANYRIGGNVKTAIPDFKI